MKAIFTEANIFQANNTSNTFIDINLTFCISRFHLNTLNCLILLLIFIEKTATLLWHINYIPSMCLLVQWNLAAKSQHSFKTPTRASMRNHSIQTDGIKHDICFKKSKLEIKILLADNRLTAVSYISLPVEFPSVRLFLKVSLITRTSPWTTVMEADGYVECFGCKLPINHSASPIIREKVDDKAIFSVTGLIYLFKGNNCHAT